MKVRLKEERERLVSLKCRHSVLPGVVVWEACRAFSGLPAECIRGSPPRTRRRSLPAIATMSLRAGIVRAVVLAGVLASVLGALPAIAGAESCPNEEVRAEQGSGRLPDCRAFELVTPEVKGDNSSIGGAFGIPFGFPDGNHVFYLSELPIPGAQSGSFTSVLSTRTPAGWVNTPLAPPAGHGEPDGLSSGYSNAVYTVAFTGDFSAAFPNSLFAPDPQDQDGAVDAYRMDLSSGAWSLAALPDTGPLTTSLNPPELFRAGTYIAGVSDNGSHVLFQTGDQLPVASGTPGEPHPGSMLYDRTGGHTYAVGVLPDGTISPTCPVEAGNGVDDAYTRATLLNYGSLSPDGTNVVFTMRPTEHCLSPDAGVYLRENNARTVQLAGESYIARSSDGSKVFTISLKGETAAGLYEYDVASGTTTTITTEGSFVASSTDGSRVYYLAGSEERDPGARLYLWDKGTSTLIPKAGEGFASYINYTSHNYAHKGDQPVATPDGSKLLFIDNANLTGYSSFGHSEAYVYDATTGSIACVSCNPTGVPPRGNAHLRGAQQYNTLLPGFSEGEISADGSRAFFETPDALVPQDTNGLTDVYEWENGRIYLISSGHGIFGSAFAGASSNGSDVFLVTADRLAPQDIESATQVYDARVDGGFPYRRLTTGCDSGQCQGPQTPAPAFGSPASATFVGLGNPGGPAPNPPPGHSKPLTIAQKLTKALKACRSKHNKHKRLACEKEAGKRYGHKAPSRRRPKS
jgi:Tol biopolymer transport system component